MESKPSFFAFIPSFVLRDPELPAYAKLMLAEIYSLADLYGECYASNKHFSETLNISERYVQKLLEILKKTEYITCDLQNPSKRLIKINFSKFDKKLKDIFIKSKGTNRSSGTNNRNNLQDNEIISERDEQEFRGRTNVQGGTNKCSGGDEQMFAHRIHIEKQIENKNNNKYNKTTKEKMKETLYNLYREWFKREFGIYPSVLPSDKTHLENIYVFLLDNFPKASNKKRASIFVNKILKNYKKVAVRFSTPQRRLDEGKLWQISMLLDKIILESEKTEKGDEISGMKKIFIEVYKELRGEDLTGILPSDFKRFLYEIDLQLNEVLKREDVKKYGITKEEIFDRVLRNFFSKERDFMKYWDIIKKFPEIFIKEVQLLIDKKEMERRKKEWQQQFKKQ